MIAILEKTAVRERVHPLSVDTYHRLEELGLIDEKVELLRGVIVQKMSKSPLHCAVLQRLLKLLRAACEPGLEIRQEQPLTLADSEPEPDLAIVPIAADDYARQHPNNALLVVEVALSTVETDREKASIYAEAGVPEYWLILPAEQRIEIFSQPGLEGYAGCDHLTKADVVTCKVLPNLKVVVASLFP
jgi:Uma2 family endonuclease